MYHSNPMCVYSIEAISWKLSLKVLKNKYTFPNSKETLSGCGTVDP